MAKEMVSISVIMPFYNASEYLSDSISSILNQTFTDFEFILLDDGSTDFPEKIISRFNDPRIRFFKEQVNKGIVFQLNKGILLASGKYIARMDADDISLPERFMKQVNFLENPKNFNIDVLGTNAKKIGAEEGVIDFKNYSPKQISFLLNFYCPLLHPSVMIRNRVFEKGLRYSSNYLYAEDFALWRMIDNGNNISIINEYLLLYRVHINQTNASSLRKKIQQESTLSALKILKNKNFDFDFYFLGKNFSNNLWVDFENKKKSVNKFSKLYLYLRAKHLNIKSSMFYALIK